MLWYKASKGLNDWKPILAVNLFIAFMIGLWAGFLLSLLF